MTTRTVEIPGFGSIDVQLPATETTHHRTVIPGEHRDGALQDFTGHALWNGSTILCTLISQLPVLTLMLFSLTLLCYITFSVITSSPGC